LYLRFKLKIGGADVISIVAGFEEVGSRGDVFSDCGKFPPRTAVSFLEFPEDVIGKARSKRGLQFKGKLPDGVFKNGNGGPWENMLP